MRGDPSLNQIEPDVLGPGWELDFRGPRQKRVKTNAWIGSAENIAQVNKMNHTPEHRTHLARLQKEWNNSSENKAHLKRLNADPEQRKKAAHALARRPSRPETVLYGLILGNPRTSKG